jgi:hypothetical protein
MVQCLAGYVGYLPHGSRLLLGQKAQLSPEVALLLSTNDPLESLLSLFKSFCAEKENDPVLYFT